MKLVEPGRPVRRLAALCFATAVLFGGQQAPYEEIRAAERSIDGQIAGFDITDPIEVLGYSRGVRLESVGAVFTAEIILSRGPVTSPFRPSIPKEDIAKLREKKVARLPELKNLMRQILVSAAISLETLPPDEQVVLGLSMFYQRWEDLNGLPRQIVMQAKRQDLLDYESGARQSLDDAVQVHEY